MMKHNGRAAIGIDDGEIGQTLYFIGIFKRLGNSNGFWSTNFIFSLFFSYLRPIFKIETKYGDGVCLPEWKLCGF